MSTVSKLLCLAAGAGGGERKPVQRWMWGPGCFNRPDLGEPDQLWNGSAPHTLGGAAQGNGPSELSEPPVEKSVPHPPFLSLILPLMFLGGPSAKPACEKPFTGQGGV